MRATSCSARDGISTLWPSSSTEVPGRSRTASRYESVETSRRPPPSAASSTPVRIGRDSSFEAAGTTWRRPSANCAGVERDAVAARLRQLRELLGRDQVQRELGPTAADARLGRRRSTARPRRVRADRTMSSASLAGITALPSSLAGDLTVAVIVRSRSLPVSSSWSPSQLEAQARQHRERAAAARGAAGRGQRFDEHVLFTSESHARGLFSC